MTLPFHLPDYSTHRWVYQTPQSDANCWVVWHKPINVQWLEILCVGSGAGGGSGFQGDAGGGGGGSAALASMLIAASQLPDALWLQVAQGAAGGSAGFDGAVGLLSYVAVSPSKTAQNLLLVSGGSAAVGGVSGLSSGVGGAGGGAATVANCRLSSRGVASFAAGQAGADWNTNATPLSTSVTCGGAGGGGLAASSGGSVVAVGRLPLIPGGDSAGSKGGTGYTLFKPFCATGGGGGGTVATGTGGVGGAGGIGGGGGGGGGCVDAGGAGGDGGAGGSGLILIQAY